MVRLRLRAIVPLEGVSWPASRRKSVDLPPPFSPTSPIRSPSIISRSISRSTGLPPKSFETLAKLASNILLNLLIACRASFVQEQHQQQGTQRTGGQREQRPEVRRAIGDRGHAQTKEREQHNHRRAKQSRLQREHRCALRLWTAPVDIRADG